MTTALRADHVGSTTTLVLCDRPNPLSDTVVRALRSELATAVERGADALVLVAEGPVFCAGFDLSPARTGEADEATAARFVAVGQLLEELRTAPILTIAACQGPAVGAGADLFAACAVRFAAPDARFRFPGAALGVCLGTGRLAELVGADRALTWVVGGDWIGAGPAADHGLVTEVVDDPRAVAAALATRATALPPGTAGLLALATRTPLATPIEMLRRSVEAPGLAHRVARLLPRPTPTTPPPPGASS